MKSKEQLMSIITSCNEMLKSLENDTVKTNETGRKINFKELHNTAQKFKFSNNILAKMAESYKKSYIRMMLYIIKDIEDKKFENALLHITKIVGATNIDIDIEAELISVYKMDERNFENIMQDLTAMNEAECQTFVTDVIYMLIASDISDKKIKELVGGVIAKLGMNEAQIRETFELINIIVNKNNAEYTKMSKRNLTVDLRNFYPYIKDFVSGILANNEKLCWTNDTNSFFNVISQLKTEENRYSYDGKKYYFNSEVVLIQNLNIKLAEVYTFVGKEINFQNCKIDMNKFNFDFEKCKKITFENCETINMDRTINIKECDCICFKNTIFKGNDSNRCFEVDECKKIEIVDCLFDNFSNNSREYRYGAYFGCFRMDNIREALLCNSSFNYCRTKHWEGGKIGCAVGGIYGTENIIFDKCKFTNCWNSSYQYGTWKHEDCLFEFSGKFKPDFGSCTFKDCADIIVY